MKIKIDDLKKEIIETKKELEQYKKGLKEIARCGAQMVIVMTWLMNI